MSIQIKVHVEGKVINLFSYHKSVTQNTDYTGRPSAKPVVQVMSFSYKTVKKDLFFEKLKSELMSDSLDFIIAAIALNAKSKKIRVLDFYVTSWEERYDSVSKSMVTYVSISFATLIINDVVVDVKYWRVTDPYSKNIPMTRNRNEEEEEEKKLIGKDYRIDKDGNITFSQNTTNNYDKLFSEKSDIKPLIIENQSILPQLINVFSKKNEWISMAKVSSSNKSDLVKIFLFAVNNSNPEWRLLRTIKNKYIIGTQFDTDLSPSSTSLGLLRDSEIYASIHSHKGSFTTMIDEMKSMGYISFNGKKLTEPQRIADNDWRQYYDAVRKGKAFKSYVFFPESGRLFKTTYKGPKPQFIRNINNNYERFFFGVF